MHDWQFLARFRDRAGYTLSATLLYFTARAVWASIAG
jgi:hypothetical protein